MANPQQGEVEFEARGKTYTFKLGTYAQAVLERRAKMPWPKFFRRPTEEWGIDDILNVFYAGLYRTHKLTEEDVADIIDEIGITRANEIMFEAFGVANAKEVAAGTADPQTAGANGTGMPS